MKTKLSFKIVKRIISVLLVMMVALAYSMIPQDTYAASKPGQVKNLKALKATQNSITLSWSKVSKAKTYKVYQQKKGWSCWKKTTKKNYKKFKKTPKLYKVKKSGKRYYYKKYGLTFIAIKTVKSPKASITGLKANTAYKFKVRAFKGKKSGKYSAVLSVKTMPESDDPISPTVPSEPVTYDAANYTNIFNRSGKNIEVRAFYDADYNRNSFDIYIRNGDGNYKIKAIDNTPDKVKRYFDDSTSMPNYGFDIMNKNKGANGGDGYKDTNSFYHVYTKPYTSDIIINVWNSKTGKLIACVKSGWYTDTALNPDNKMFDFATKANNPFYNRYHRIMTDFINDSGIRTMFEEGVLDDRSSTFIYKLEPVCYYGQDDIAHHNMANLPGEDCNTWFDGSEREINYTHAYYQVTGIHGGDCNFYAVLEEDIIKNEIGGFTRIQIQGIDNHRYVVAQHNSGVKYGLDINGSYGHGQDPNNYLKIYNDETWRNHVKTYVNHYNDWFAF